MIEYPIYNYADLNTVLDSFIQLMQVIKINASITGKVLGKFCGLVLDFQGGIGNRRVGWREKS